MKLLKNGIAIVLSIAVLSAFTYGLWLAIKYSTASPPTPALMPSAYSTFLSSILTILVANFGAMIGVTMYQALQLRTANKPLTYATATAPINWLQWVAAGVYVLAIIFMCITWYRVGFTEDTTLVVSLVPETARTAIALVLLIVAAALGVR